MRRDRSHALIAPSSGSSVPKETEVETSSVRYLHTFANLFDSGEDLSTREADLCSHSSGAASKFR
jgi:hypothetical protein